MTSLNLLQCPGMKINFFSEHFLSQSKSIAFPAHS